MLAACLLGMAVITGVTGLLVISGQTGEFTFYGRIIVTAVSFATTFSFVFLHFRSKKTFWIDISGSGQIRMREYTHNVSAHAPRPKAAAKDAEVFYLLDGSTLWPMLLLLRLVSDSGHKSNLLIFSDSVKAETFKAIYISCQWLLASQRDKR